MINKNWKILTGTTLGVFMSAIVMAPASAEYVAQRLQPQNSMEQRESVGQKEIKVGQIKAISGSTVTVMMKDGMSQDIESSANTLSQWQLSEGSYVLISNNEIVGKADRGTIRSVTNSVAEVELEDGDVITLDISQDLAKDTEIKAGAEVFVANNEIVASAESMDAETMGNSSDRDSSGEMGTYQSQTETQTPDSSGTTETEPSTNNQPPRTPGTYESQPDSETQTPGSSGTYESQPDSETQTPSSGTYNSQPGSETQTPDSSGTYESQPDSETQTPDSSGTYESQPDTTEQTQPEESSEPVRGMW